MKSPDSPRSTSRRSFLATSSATVAAMTAAGASTQLLNLSPAAAAEGAKPYERNIRKSLKFGMIKEGETIAEKLAAAKAAGFHGVEFEGPIAEEEIPQIQQAKKDLGLEVPGLVCGKVGRMLGNDMDESERQSGLEQFATSLRQAKELGSTTVLCYPGAVNAEHRYDRVYETLQKSLKELIPVCEETGVKIACENVWNNIFMSPVETRDFVDSFDSPWIGWYFDVGNIVRYGWPEQWIYVLGKRILKLDIKEYDRDIMMNDGTRKGFGVELGEGSIDWAAVMKAVDEVEYEGGWGSAEVPGGDLARLKDISSRMDKLFAM